MAQGVYRLNTTPGITGMLGAAANQRGRSALTERAINNWMRNELQEEAIAVQNAANRRQNEQFYVKTGTDLLTEFGKPILAEAMAPDILDGVDEVGLPGSELAGPPSYLQKTPQELAASSSSPVQELIAKAPQATQAPTGARPPVGGEVDIGSFSDEDFRMLMAAVGQAGGLF